MTFDLQPTLRGDLVELSPTRESDWTDLFAVASDPLIWEQHPERERYREELFRRYFDGALASGGGLTVRDVSDGRVIGASRYHGYDAAASEIEIGWTFLARRCWGGRYNGEMKRLMLAHAFRFVDVVIFLIGTDNVRSRRAVERIGARFAGHRADFAGVSRACYELKG